MEFDLVRGLRDLSAAPDVPTDAVPLGPVAARVRRGRTLRAAGVAATSAAAVLVIGAVVYASPWQPTPPVAGPTPSVEPTPEPPPEPVTITWSYEATATSPSALWSAVAEEFEAAHPHVTVDLQALDPAAAEADPEAGDLPDLFPQADPPELAALAEAGALRDLTDDLADEIAAIGALAGPSTVGGRVYGLPYTFGIEGFWYNPQIFEQVGITEEPTTLDELLAAVARLRVADFAPIELVDHPWPDRSGWTHYWYEFAVRTCSPSALAAAQDRHVFSDPCFVDAGRLLDEFLTSLPFEEGYLAADPMQGYEPPPAVLLGTGQAGMALLGPDGPDLVAAVVLTSDNARLTSPESLGWFPFPAIQGTDGDPTAVMGTGEGFSVSAGAPDEAVDLLRYIVSADAQRRLGASGAGVPVLPGAADSVTDPYLAMTVDTLHGAGYVQPPLDTAYGPEVAAAMDEAIIRFLDRTTVYLHGGPLPPAAIVEAMTAAAATVP